MTFHDIVFASDIAIRDRSELLPIDALDQFSAGMYRSLWQHVMAPGHLKARESFLAKNIGPLERRHPCKCVCFVFGPGEDEDDRATTRIGGLPFWPATRSWPTDQDGSPKEFIAQFDFRNVQWPESLPGDVLTVHFDWEGDEEPFGNANDGDATLVWHDFETTSELIEPHLLPFPIDGTTQIGPYYSQPVLVTDYQSDWAESAQALTIHGVKIGGHPPLYGDNWPELNSDVQKPVFLCSIGTILPEEAEEEKNCWLPSKLNDPLNNTNCLQFPGMAVFVVVYPQGNPDDLRWMIYLP